MRRNGRTSFSRIAVAEVLRDAWHEVMLLVSEKDIDALALSGRESFRVEKLPDCGIAVAIFSGVFWFPSPFLRKPALCRSIYTTFKPQVILGMGGFTSTAPSIGRSDTRYSDFYPRIKRYPWKSKPHDSSACPYGHAWFQGMRAFFSKDQH
jgi:UDP-N-acetylglucosamine--N-acetylmuramyl-(pentapeptide) pyrophosphoryl-undecaprenol N-acetylglucosamine transferase